MEIIIMMIRLKLRLGAATRRGGMPRRQASVEKMSQLGNLSTGCKIVMDHDDGDYFLPREIGKWLRSVIKDRLHWYCPQFRVNMYQGNDVINMVDSYFKPVYFLRTVLRIISTLQQSSGLNL